MGLKDDLVGEQEVRGEKTEERGVVVGARALNRESTLANHAWTTIKIPHSFVRDQRGQKDRAQFAARCQP